MSKIDWESIFSMSEEHELLKLSEWAKIFSPISNIAIEVGSYQGKTAVLLGEYFPTVFAIDLYGNIEKGLEKYDEIGKVSLDIMVQNVKNRKLIGNVIPVIAPSSILSSFDGTRPGLIFVDGSHDYNVVYWDLYWSNLIVHKDGIVIAHDYKRPGYGYPPYDPNHPHHGSYDPWWGVAKAVDELLEDDFYEVYEHYSGIIALKPLRK